MTDVERIEKLLGELYHAKGVVLWLFAENRMLDGRTAASLIEAGETQRVIALLEGLADGVVF